MLKLRGDNINPWQSRFAAEQNKEASCTGDHKHVEAAKRVDRSQSLRREVGLRSSHVEQKNYRASKATAFISRWI